MAQHGLWPLPPAFLAGRHTKETRLPVLFKRGRRGQISINSRPEPESPSTTPVLKELSIYIVGRLGNNHTLYQDRNLCWFFSQERKRNNWELCSSSFVLQSKLTWNILFILFFPPRTGSHLYPSLVSNSQPSFCLSLSNARITGTCCHVWL